MGQLNKDRFTLTLFAMRDQDVMAIEQLVRGLKFRCPIQPCKNPPDNADIVIVDTDQKEGRQWVTNRQHSGLVVQISTILPSPLPTPNTLCLAKPIRARELINCLNKALENLH